VEYAVLCEVSPGLRPSERTVAVCNVQGRREYLRIEANYLRQEGGRAYLPVGFLYEHPESNSVLIELPLEADSGARRVFVPKTHVISGERVSA
jgi:hypothetical protein